MTTTQVAKQHDIIDNLFILLNKQTIQLNRMKQITLLLLGSILCFLVKAQPQENQDFPNTLNGVNLDQLVKTVEHIQSDPEIARFRFRSTTSWIKGGHSQTRIKEFYGAKMEDQSRQTAFVIEGDEPAILLGENHGPNAVESVLHALASCLTVGVVYNAEVKGIPIKALSFDLEGDLDLQGFLGLSESVRPGYSNIQLKMNVDTDASEAQIRELFEYVQKTSPVLDIIRNPVPVSLEIKH
jgi:uncharacterized OsmC-like protein